MSALVIAEDGIKLTSRNDIHVSLPFYITFGIDEPHVESEEGGKGSVSSP